jgi:hypothetical protein
MYKNFPAGLDKPEARFLQGVAADAVGSVKYLQRT